MSGETVKISILVPIYNVEGYVKPCIESIIGQTYRNLEIILVDDGSTDSCPEICDGYAKRDGRIRVIHKCNGGVTSARKAGAVAATGDYVLCVDGDDWIEKDRVEILVRDGILPSHADMIHLSGIISDYREEGKCIRLHSDVPIKLFENDEIENEVFPLLSNVDEAFSRAIPMAIWTWAIRRELLLKNLMLVDDRLSIGEDLLCEWLCLLDAKSVMTIQQGGYHYVQRASSIGHQLARLSAEPLLQLKIVYQEMKKQLELKRASKKICKIYAHLMVQFTIMTNYHSVLQKFPNYLFPFPKVNSGSRIVVYGAGNFGRIFVQSMDKTKKCSVVLWVDQNQNLPSVPGHTISSRDAIFSADYDFIVVAIIKANVAKEVKRSLILDGIPEAKIATMDARVISEDALPDEIKDF